MISLFPSGLLEALTSTNKMPVKVLPAEDADMDRIFEIAATAFARNEPVWDTLYPNHWTPAGRKQGGERMRLVKNSDSHTTYLKAIDDSTGEIMGMAKWNIWQNGKHTDPAQIQGTSGDYWDTQEDKEYADKLIPLFLEKRIAAIERTGGNLASLDVLSVDPAHQRKKVGDALVKWGLDKADQLGLEAVVESSVCAKGLYAKNGFVFQEHVDLQVPGVTDRPTGGFAWFTRPKQNGSA